MEVEEDLLKEFHAGVALSPDPSRGAEVLVEFFSDANRVRLAGVNARRLAEERFSRDVLAARLEFVLRRAQGFLNAVKSVAEGDGSVQVSTHAE